ncbi:MAG: hypothetical protein A4E19_01875 [Nitrospira sp. SG-bin1]|nr:MAG: hypothetical protein A4E19_01875 [Nitrospira sp. SG-bin1]
MLYWIALSLTVTIVAQGSALAEWVALDDRYQSHPLQTAYIDIASIRREGDWVVLSALIDWKAMQGGRTPTRFYSTKLTKQFDCEGKLVRTLAATDFYGHMGTAEVIGGGRHTSEGHWVPIEPGTINQGFWEAACAKG